MNRKEQEIINNIKHLPLIDNILTGFNLTGIGHEIIVNLFFISEVDTDKKIVLKLINVVRFNLYINQDIYYISDYKLLFNHSTNLYYLSLDPYNLNNEISEKDKDIIEFAQVEVINI